MATITRIQEDVDLSGSDTRTVIFPSTPTERNLLVVYAQNRSGVSAADATISGTGWSKFLSQDVQINEASWRRATVGWWKQAGASEPTNVTVTWTGATFAAAGREFASDEAATWTYVDHAVNDNGQTTDGTSVSLGTTGSIAAQTNLVIGMVGAREDNEQASAIASFASLNLTDVLEVESPSAAFEAIMGIGWLQSDAAGTKTSTATISSGNNTGLNGSIAVFSPDAAAGNDEIAGTTTLAFVGSANLRHLASIAGTTSVDFTSTGDMSEGRIVGDAPLAFTPAGALTADGELAGTSPLAFAPTGTFGAPGALAAAVTVEFTTSVNPFEGVDRATLTGLGELAGIAPLAFTGAGVFVPDAMEGQSAVAFSPTATIRAEGVLAGTSTPAFTTDGALISQRVLGDAAVVFTGATSATAKGALAGNAPVAFGGFALTGTQYDLIRTPVGWEPYYDVLKDPEFIDIAELEASGDAVWASWLPGTNPTPRGSANIQIDEDLIRQEANGNATWARWAPGVNNKRSANLQINIRDALNANFLPS